MLPELLAPAGSLEKLEYALAYGADAVYLGLPFFSLRARENDFDLQAIESGIALARTLGKKVYVTANIFARNRKIHQFDESLKVWQALKPDAMIMSDPGLMMRARQVMPDIPIHLSVQANCMNYRAVEFWHKHLNIQRIILSRELSLDEIAEIKQRVPEVELECFVHGAICIAYSGRCLLSSYFSYRDANQGVCDNSCRERFHLLGKSEKTHVKDDEFFIEDLRSPGEFYRIDEDDNGTYIMNSKDLRLIEHLEKLHKIGVDSFKIEGRTKSIYYVALVTRAYRRAIDNLGQGASFDPQLIGELNKVANRDYHSGFLLQNPDQSSHLYDTGQSRYFSQRFVGLVRPSDVPTEFQDSGYCAVDIRGKIAKGDRCEVLSPHFGSFHTEILDIKSLRGRNLEVAHSGTGIHFLKLEQSPPPYAILSAPIVADHSHHASRPPDLTKT